MRLPNKVSRKAIIFTRAVHLWPHDGTRQTISGYAEVLKNARKDAHITQQQLAIKIGKKRESISQLEKGDIDMQLSMFILISEALGLKFALTL